MRKLNLFSSWAIDPKRYFFIHSKFLLFNPGIFLKLQQFFFPSHFLVTQYITEQQEKELAGNEEREKKIIEKQKEKIQEQRKMEEFNFIKNRM